MVTCGISESICRRQNQRNNIQIAAFSGARKMMSTSARKTIRSSARSLFRLFGSLTIRPSSRTPETRMNSARNISVKTLRDCFWGPRTDILSPSFRCLAAGSDTARSLNATAEKTKFSLVAGERPVKRQSKLESERGIYVCLTGTLSTPAITPLSERHLSLVVRRWRGKATRSARPAIR